MKVTHPELSVVEKLQSAYTLLAESLAQSPQLYDWRLDQSLLILSIVLNRARRSRKLRRPSAWLAQQPDLFYER